MKIIVINGSPRKKWNTAQLLESFTKGMCSAKEKPEIKYVHLYDYKYTGCRSCFACKLAANVDNCCQIRDDIRDLLAECREADALVIGSPVYFCDLSAQLKAFLERLMYPGKTAKAIPTYFVLSMNAPEDLFQKHIQPQIEMTYRYCEGNFGVYPKQFCSYDTWQRDHEERYKKSGHDMSAKKIRHDVQFPVDLQNAYDAGTAFVKELFPG